MKVKEIGYSIYIGGLSLFMVFNIDFDIFLILAILMVLDTITGVAKSWKMRRFTSHDLKVGAIAKALGLIIVFSLGLFSYVISHDTEAKDVIIKVFMILMACSEVVSMIQNYIIYKTGEDIEEYDAITNVMQYMLKFLRGLLEKYIK